MEYDKNMISTFVSPGTKEGATGITHFLIQAKQIIRFDEEESEKLSDDIFSLMKDFNCFIFTNLQGVEVFEEEIIETSNYDDIRIERIRKKLSDKVVESTSAALAILEKNLK